MDKTLFEFEGKAPNLTLVKYRGQIEDVVQAVLSGNGETVTVPQGVRVIGAKAFFTSNAQTVILPDGVERIDDGAFMASLTLSKVVLPSTLTAIGDGAFQSTLLSSVVLPQGLITIGDGAFNSTDIKELVIPSSVTSIGANAFAHCKKLCKIYIPSSVQTVGIDAFADCPNLVIYLSGSKPDGWKDEFNTEYVETYNDGYAFDFHRGGVSGGWFETVAKTVASSFNPDRRPVVTNASLDDYNKAK